MKSLLEYINEEEVESMPINESVAIAAAAVAAALGLGGAAASQRWIDKIFDRREQRKNKKLDNKLARLEKLRRANKASWNDFFDNISSLQGMDAEKLLKKNGIDMNDIRKAVDMSEIEKMISDGEDPLEISTTVLNQLSDGTHNRKLQNALAVFQD